MFIQNPPTRRTFVLKVTVLQSYAEASACEALKIRIAMH
jgi:hypothetical protein